MGGEKVSHLSFLYESHFKLYANGVWALRNSNPYVSCSNMGRITDLYGPYNTPIWAI